jgi:excisionase family DNA binding protein
LNRFPNQEDYNESLNHPFRTFVSLSPKLCSATVRAVPVVLADVLAAAVAARAVPTISFDRTLTILLPLSLTSRIIAPLLTEPGSSSRHFRRSKTMVGVSIESVLQQVAQLPLSERQLLKQLLNDHHAPAAFSPEPELSLTQAAELLNVSVGFVEGLLATGELSSATTGGTAIKLADLLAYKKRSDEEAAAILDELTAQAQELKLGYE